MKWKSSTGNLSYRSNFNFLSIWKLTQIIIDITADRDVLITETLIELKRKGYKLKFRREAACIYCFEWQQWIMPANFTVDESYFFEEIENADAGRKLYAISLLQGGKGFLIDASNVYMDNISPEMAQRLNKITRHTDDFINVRTMKKPVELINHTF